MPTLTSVFSGGPLRSDEAWNKLASAVGHWQMRGFGVWSIVEQSSKAVVGRCGFLWPEDWPRCELTWWILPEFRRRGIAIEASRAALDYVFSMMSWETAETHMRDENLAARALTEKLGGKIITREMFPDGHKRNVFQFDKVS